jgi:hypothetical protein
MNKGKFQLNQPFRQVLVSKRLKSTAPPTSEAPQPSSEPPPERDTLLSDAVTKACPGQELEEYEPVSHGITLPWSTPVLWLAKNLGYPDNFVHVVLRRKRREGVEEED